MKLRHIVYALWTSDNRDFLGNREGNITKNWKLARKLVAYGYGKDVAVPGLRYLIGYLIPLEDDDG